MWRKHYQLELVCKQKTTHTYRTDVQGALFKHYHDQYIKRNYAVVVVFYFFFVLVHRTYDDGMFNVTNNWQFRLILSFTLTARHNPTDRPTHNKIPEFHLFSLVLNRSVLRSSHLFLSYRLIALLRSVQFISLKCVNSFNKKQKSVYFT